MQYTSGSSRATSIDHEYSIPQYETERPYVVVVDDDESILSVVMLLLATEGYTGVGFTESEQVLPFLGEMGKRGEQHLPTLIILDLMMPRVSGYEIAAALSQDESYKHISILIMTADARICDKNAVPGADDWLSKPFHIDALIKKLEHYLAPVSIRR